MGEKTDNLLNALIGSSLANETDEPNKLNKRLNFKLSSKISINEIVQRIVEQQVRRKRDDYHI
jgi:hypothetical protein